MEPTILESSESTPFPLVLTLLPLSLRQIQVWGLMAKGLTNQEIAQRLALSEKTIKAHATGLFRALGVKNARQAIVKFYTEPLARSAPETSP